MTSCKRLHISPLDPELLAVVLPSSLREKASNISFHTIETFPEQRYGFLDIPEAEADRLRKKLNGCTLRGFKMRVSEARPEKASKGKTTEGEELHEEKTAKQKKKRRKEEGVIPGYELQGRKVKRGWTETSTGESGLTKSRSDKKEKKPKTKTQSKTGEAECLFKTSVPPNAVPVLDTKDGKVKKRKRGDSSRDLVVQEFTNTTKHATFLRDKGALGENKGSSEYVEGKGWLDEDGNVVEAEVKRRRSKSKPEQEQKEGGKPPSRRSSRLEVPSVEVSTLRTRSSRVAVEQEPETSSSGTSSDSDSNGDAVESFAEGSTPSHTPTPKPIEADEELNAAAGARDEMNVDRVERLSITRSSESPPLQHPGPTSAPVSKEVHPLEALFKRPNTAASHTSKKPNLEVSTSFNPLESDHEEPSSQGLLMPQTPFTQQDIRQRRQRSAAPTPDTAAPGRTFGDLWEGTSDISDGDDEMEFEALETAKEDPVKPEAGEKKPESEFRQWFYEHRGENKRKSRRRKKEAIKEKRQKDNRAKRA